MRKSKKFWILLIVLLVLIPFFPVIYLVGGMTVYMVGMMVYSAGSYIFTPNPPKPEITYGEFPFELVYEMDGETVVVNDVYVCEYDGIGVSATGVGKYREWTGYVKSTESEEVILFQHGEIAVVCSVGVAEYYMNEPEYPGRKFGEDPPPKPFISLMFIEEDGTLSQLPSDPENNGEDYGEIEKRLLEDRNFKILSWTFSDPIENTFE